MRHHGWQIRGPMGGHDTRPMDRGPMDGGPMIRAQHKVYRWDAMKGAQHKMYPWDAMKGAQHKCALILCTDTVY